MTDNLTGTVALVTGASSGIGAATARRLAGAGASVALVARRSDRLQEVAAQIEQDGGNARVIVADITSRDGAQAATDETVAAFGRLDTLVNNAGMMLVGPFADSSDGDWERMIDINILGLLYMTKASIPHLIRAAADEPRRTADIVNISSTAGRIARAGAAVYNLTKFGVNGFAESLRQELQNHHVRVSVIEPGVVATELVSHTRDDKLRGSIEAQMALIETLQPEDIADAVTYIVTSARRVAVNEVLVRPADQSW
jgi:NADP-dependent 3-hydroxy acid dehydrogenase YdfG